MTRLLKIAAAFSACVLTLCGILWLLWLTWITLGSNTTITLIAACLLLASLYAVVVRQEPREGIDLASDAQKDYDAKQKALRKLRRMERGEVL